MSAIYSLTINQHLRETTQQLHAAGITSAALDAELLLAHTLRQSRTWLHAHADELLSEKERVSFQELVERRLKREPVAYITGGKEFYGREFDVTPDVLIPRPESEDIITLLGSTQQGDSLLNVLDVGTGSGCLAITAKLEFPQLEVAACDINQRALAVAKKNARKFGAKITFYECDLLAWFVIQPQNFDVIIANLPYVDKTWETSPETTHEPPVALFAKDGGLALIKKLICQSKDRLNSGGSLLLEADPEQHEAVMDYAGTRNFIHRRTLGYALSFEYQP